MEFFYLLVRDPPLRQRCLPHHGHRHHPLQSHPPRSSQNAWQVVLVHLPGDRKKKRGRGKEREREKVSSLNVLEIKMWACFCLSRADQTIWAGTGGQTRLGWPLCLPLLHLVSSPPLQLLPDNNEHNLLLLLLVVSSIVIQYFFF